MEKQSDRSRFLRVVAADQPRGRLTVPGSPTPRSTKAQCLPSYWTCRVGISAASADLDYRGRLPTWIGRGTERISRSLPRLLPALRCGSPTLVTPVRAGSLHRLSTSLRRAATLSMMRAATGSMAGHRWCAGCGRQTVAHLPKYRMSLLA